MSPQAVPCENDRMFYAMRIHDSVAMTALVSLAALAMGMGVAFRWPGWRRATIVFLFGALALASATVLVGELLRTGTGDLWIREPALELGVAMLAAVGVAGGWRSGHWVALVVALQAALEILYALAYLTIREPGWRPDDLGILAAASIVLVGLAMTGTRATDEKEPGRPGSVSAGRGRLMRAGLLVTLLGVPALVQIVLGYPWWGSDHEMILALVTAALLVAGAALVLRGFTVGVLVLASGVAANVSLLLITTRDWSVGTQVAPCGLVLILAAIGGPAWRRLRG